MSDSNFRHLLAGFILGNAFAVTIVMVVSHAVQ